MDSPALIQTTHTDNPWRLLRTLSLFRLLCCLIFIAAPFLLPTQHLLPTEANLAVFLFTSAAYGLIALLFLALYRWRRPPLSLQVQAQIGTDIGFLTVLMHQAGGIESGVGILLCASLSASALLRRPLLAYLYASIATVAILGMTVYEHRFSFARDTHYTEAATLCIALFVVAVLSAYFNRHRLDSSAVIDDQQQQLDGLQTLSDEVLRQFDHGLLAISGEGFVDHSNPAAQRLLGVNNIQKNVNLKQLAPALNAFLDQGNATGTVIHQNTPLHVTLKTINSKFRLLTLVSQSMRDTETQRLNMANLGQWTASVAHEVRNPLSAITQAALLLSEQTDHASQEHKLAAIIQRNSQRIDRIVTDILDLARPSKHRENTLLHQWLQAVLDEFRSQHQLSPKQLELSWNVEHQGLIDRHKLRHVIDNLCHNSLKHGGKSDIRIHVLVDQQQGKPLIRISDNGAGISPALRAHLFEPFFSNSNNSTGLGLFIAKQICDQQQIQLKLCDSPVGTVFEMQFPQALQTEQTLQAAA